jgi:predicted permease
MIRVARWLGRLVRSIFDRAGAERELGEEIRFHLEMEAASHEARGIDPEQATALAAREFGSETRVRQASREVRRLLPLEDFGRDLVIGWRNLRRSPGVAVAAVLSLGLGIGATTTMFSITSGILRELPVDEPERLVHVAGVDRQTGDGDLRLGSWEIRAIVASQRSLEAVGIFEDEAFRLGDADRYAERRSGAAISPEVFAVLRVSPALGRGFTTADGHPGAVAVVILSDRLWRERFDAAPDVVGRAIRLNGMSRIVVGVMPAGFRFPAQEDLWVPAPALTATGPGEGSSWTVIGRLRPAATLERATAELAIIGARLAAEAPASHRDFGLRARPYRDEMIRPGARPIFGAMVMVVSFVLLIACGNVANLLVARAIGRNRELAVRAALGATRRRIAAQVLAEVAILATLGGALGVGGAHLGVTAFNAAAGFELTYWMKVAVDPAVLGFAAALVIGSLLAAGLAPALQAGRVELADVLKEGTRGSSGIQLGRAARGLVGLEVALSAILLVVTALTAEGIHRSADPALPVDPATIVAADLELGTERSSEARARNRLLRTVTERLEVRSDGVSAGFATVIPGTAAPRMPVEIEGAGLVPATSVASVSPGFFRAFGAAPLSGRDFGWGDDAAAPPVAIVNRRFAELHFPGVSPIGKRIRFDPSQAGFTKPFAGQTAAAASSAGPWATIVGLVPELGLRGFRERESDGVYLPVTQTGPSSLTLVVAAAGDPARWTREIREVVTDLDRDVPVIGAATLRARLARAQSAERIFAFLFLTFGGIALAMAIVGLAGLVGFAARQRAREIGIRLALGAKPGSVVRLITRSGLRQLAIGLVVGLAAGALVAPRFGEALMGGNPRDWRIYAGIAVILGGSGLLAGLIPARRALRLGPAEVLREE